MKWLNTPQTNKMQRLSNTLLSSAGYVSLAGYRRSL